MIKTTAMILEELKGYKSPANKLNRMVKNGEYIPIVKGLYETDRTTPGYVLAGSIYGPSYLSFEFALSYYGLIPEAVYVFTSATYRKKKQKRYETPFGAFTYRDVPPNVYPDGIRIEKEDAYFYKIASPEKALCDKLYTVPPVSNKKELVLLLFDDLRIDEQEFEKLSAAKIRQIGSEYNCANVKMLVKLLKGKIYE